MIPNSHFFCNIFVPLRLTNFDHLFEHLLTRGCLSASLKGQIRLYR